MIILPFSRKNKRKSWTKRIIWLLFCLFLLVFTAGASFAVYIFFNTPGAELTHRKVAQTSTIYDRTGEHVLYEMHGEENRKIIPHNEIPDVVRIATIVVEDNNFYSHHGVDFISILRAVKENLQKNELAQGASTITQQLARNAFLTREKSWTRKLKEMALAFKIEMKYSKDEILDFYLNEIPYGSNAYGIESASQIFFGKHAKELTINEAALLAALPKATSTYSPYGNHTDLLIARQQMILEKLRDQADPQGKKAVEIAMKADTLGKIIPLKEKIEAPHFVFYVKDQLEQNYNTEIIEEGGLKIYTTLDYDMQKNAEAIVKNYVISEGGKNNFSNGALVAIDPKTGDVLAMVGSRDYYDTQIDGKVNVTVQKRQPGSSFKPIVYAKAFEKGFQPETMFFDAPASFGPDGSGKEYAPKNYSGNFNGLVSMRKALGGSLNIPAVKTLYLAGLPDTIELAKRLGITTLTRTNTYGLSLALGGGETELVEETAAFSVFANDGKRNPLRSIIKVVDSGGKETNTGLAEKLVMDPQTARKVSSILSDNSARSYVFGTNNLLNIPGKTVAAKTGTNQDFRDAWTVGYAPSLAVGVWAGNNDYSPMKEGADGIYVAAPMWRRFMDYALANRQDEKFPEYIKVTSNKMFITGNIGCAADIADSGSKKKKKKKKDKCSVDHDILYYINKDDPLGPTEPNFSDPMFGRWESGIGSGDNKKN
ncbi:MAG: PBP1A family penicillin-binding protein [bacterium]|nr:PBP1A family penicillin-binding protein [bacterium]